jgi:hypothetical protein
MRTILSCSSKRVRGVQLRLLDGTSRLAETNHPSIDIPFDL